MTPAKILVIDDDEDFRQLLVALLQTDPHVRVSGQAGDGETFQWIETFYGDVALMSLVTHRYLRLEPDGRVTGDSPGGTPRHFCVPE